ncbi:hypothetical protein AMTR_s00025p00157980 [Amborella trichopoda]|uniref:Uncharacterized protein n=1 Tax=Amborella trichopoda TaxID=13333 RepID=W1PX09_AMBTC|nr:hypothetical protein AMTR_s00025p00157980 [Amborella trichopoda]
MSPPLGHVEEGLGKGVPPLISSASSENRSNNNNSGGVPSERWVNAVAVKQGSATCHTIGPLVLCPLRLLFMKHRLSQYHSRINQ